MDLQEKQCELCKYYIYDGRDVNTNQYNMCEGSHCEEAEDYLEDYLEEEKINKRDGKIDEILDSNH